MTDAVILMIDNKTNIERAVSASLRAITVPGTRPRIAVAVSGGADSTALLAALAATGRADLLALHCDFHLRGAESLRDERHVRALCRGLGVAVIVRDFNVDAYIKEHPGTSAEMACRDLRYRWFGDVMKAVGALRLAVAHNAGDNAETLLLNLLRGSGTAGLKGMVPDNGRIWRPLLTVPRRDILQYLEERQIDYVTDSTNLESEYRRNYLRNEILPRLRDKWPGADTALARSLECIAAENAVVEQALLQALPVDGEPLHSRTVLDFAAPELLVRRYLAPLRPRTTTASEVVAAMRAAKPAVRTWQLPGGKAELRGGRLSIFAHSENNC